MNDSITTPSTTNATGTNKVNLGGLSVYYSPHVNPNTANISYSGLLHNSGAQGVYLHTGIGPAWENIYDYPMQRTVNGWRSEVHVNPNQILNFCFKDSAGNWDNNNQKNWALITNPY